MKIDLEALKAEFDSLEYQFSAETWQWIGPGAFKEIHTEMDHDIGHPGWESEWQEASAQLETIGATLQQTGGNYNTVSFLMEKPVWYEHYWEFEGEKCDLLGMRARIQPGQVWRHVVYPEGFDSFVTHRYSKRHEE